MLGRYQYVESMDMSNRIILCVSNAYLEKYYYNPIFEGIPQSIQDELKIMSVLFTQDMGGIFIIAFEEDGTLILETEYEENDYAYDEIGSGLLIGEIKRRKAELLESLNLYYRIFILKESPADVLEESERV